MWLLTIIIWYGSGNMQAFTKELPTEVLCHKVGASYHTMAAPKENEQDSPSRRTLVQYQCIKIN